MPVAVLIAATLFVCVSPERAGAQPYEVPWYTIDGGGVMWSTGGGYKVGGTIGQPDAGELSGGMYVVSGGFWFRAGACPASSAPQAEMIQTAPPGKQDVVSTKNRFLSFNTDPADTGHALGQIIRVKFVSLPSPYDKFNGLSMWVGDPWDVTEIAGSTDATPPTFKAARLQCGMPAPRSDWAALGTIHVFGAYIVPDGEYEIRVLDATCSQGQIENDAVAPPLLLNTSKYGDVCAGLPLNNDGQWGPADGVAGITSDVVAVLKKSLNKPGLVKARADLGPGLTPPGNYEPDLLIRVSQDVVWAVQAYLAQPYPFPPPQPWPCP